MPRPARCPAEDEDIRRSLRPTEFDGLIWPRRDTLQVGPDQTVVLSPTANGMSQPFQPEVRQDLEPMGDLSWFEIDDLTPEEEDEFFRILEEA